MPGRSTFWTNSNWFIGDICAFVVGCGTRLLLSNPQRNPLEGSGYVGLISHLSHYLFHPLTYSAVLILFLLRIIQLKGIGFWSVFLSFIVGGISGAIILTLV